MMKKKVRLMVYTVTVAVMLHNLQHPLVEYPEVSLPSPAAQPVIHHAKTPEGTLCSRFMAANPNILWKKLQGTILKASHWPEKNANNSNFTSWVGELLTDHFNSAAIEKALLQRADPHQVKPILGVISKRLAYLENTNFDYSEPLHIFVSGGSVAAGHNCETNHIGIPAADWRKAPDCPWPIRLQHLFNEVFFQGKEVVQVTNLAAGGSSSEIGTVVLEYHLFPKDVQNELPHIIVWSHAANDAQEDDLDAVYYKRLPDFISAARNLRPCDQDLPLVVMFDDSYWFRDYNTVNEMTGIIAKVSAWFGLMSASHANVVNHKVWSNHQNSSAIKSIMGTDVDLHYG